MSPHLAPEDPQFSTESERAVWTRLRTTLRADDTLIANLRLTDMTRDHEADLVLVMPDLGVLVVEVKGAGTSVRDGRWMMTHRGEHRSIDPVRQAMSAQYAIRDYVESDPRWSSSSRGRVRWAHTVVTPFTDLGPHFQLPDCPRWMVHDRSDQAALAARLAGVLQQFQTNVRAPVADDCDLIAEILTGRTLQADATVEDVSDERLDRADRLTREQGMILDVTRLLNRVEVRGGAGSGKTALALAQARQLQHGRSDRPSQRVALLCYSMGLAAHFERVVAQWSRNERPSFVGTFESLANRWGIASGTRDETDFWEHRLPLLMAERAAELPAGQRYDSFVVDEAQDFAESWWRPIITALRDETDGGLYLYSDENQRLFQRFGRPPVPLLPLVLDHNLRNTRQIAETFRPLAPLRMRLEGGDGPDVVHIEASADDALDVADDQVDLLLDEGWQPSSIALLTTGRRHPEQRSLQESLGEVGYWRTFYDKELVFYGHVLGFKGLERRAVVLCINEDGSRERLRERIYVGLSRATDRLIVVGPSEVIGKAGAEVLKALRVP